MGELSIDDPLAGCPDTFQLAFAGTAEAVHPNGLFVAVHVRRDVPPLGTVAGLAERVTTGALPPQVGVTDAHTIVPKPRLSLATIAGSELVVQPFIL
jgi:hypothetical protein